MTSGERLQNQHSVAAGAMAATGGLAVGTYKVHPSALVLPSTSTSITSTTSSSSQPTSALAATQHVAAMAASDSLYYNHTVDQDHGRQQGTEETDAPTTCSGKLLGFVSQLLPLLLTVVIVYIYYIYTVHVCIGYIWHTLNHKVQAGIYIGILNTLSLLFFISYARTIFRSPGSPLKPPRNPAVPAPFTTTPYQPQRTPKTYPGKQADYSKNNQDPSPNTPLLATGGASSQGVFYQSMGRSSIKSAKDSTIGSPRATEDVYVDMHSEQENDPLLPANRPLATLSIAKRDGRPRWCDICLIVKPDRCHHCSECDQCVLRMDHHCPWVNGCIGYNNHKFFYLFLLYASALALFVVVTMVPVLITAIRRCELNGPGQHDSFPSDCVFDIQWAVITVVSFLLAILIVSFTGAHTIYIVQNRTTIESLQDLRNTYIRVQFTDTESTLSTNQGYRPEFKVVKVEHGEQLWDRGSWLANWKSIMGNSWWLWFVPYGNTPGDGLHEVYNDSVYKRVVSNAMEQVQSSAGRTLANGGHYRSTSQLRLSSTRAPTAVRTTSSQSTLRQGSGTPEPILSLAVPTKAAGGGNASSGEESETSVSSMGRSFPTPHTSPRLASREVR
ncbi:palmitoyltransferase ZDHHC2/15/20 [Entomortierella parvispora]|uniref:Palmitoyltransferase n=1 Tax=Entomortierella parvispora TaxID=205924 RepID=A0A9P3H6N9_9FUNG|nr:palmitoyltransferase ZDHHC2/15/20 [Entomortierella parvispora]